MRKRNGILAILLLLAIAAAGLCIYLHPAWVSAKILQEKMDLVHFTYELEVELDKGELPEKQVELFGTLARLTGFEESAMFHFTIKGSVWGDKLHALIYPEGAQEPVFEFYLSDGTDIINETMLYNAVRNNLVRQYSLLDYLLPVEENDVYMTLGQVEQIFNVDLGSIRDFSLPFENVKLSRSQYFIALVFMARQEQGNKRLFELMTEQAQIRLELPDTGGFGAVTVRFDAQEPADALAEEEALLSRLGVDLSAEQLKMLKSISVTVAAGEGREFALPDNYASQDRVNFLSGIRALLEKIDT